MKRSPLILIAILAQLLAAWGQPDPLDYLHLPRQREDRGAEIEWIRAQVEQRCELGQVGQVRRLLNEAATLAERLVMQHRPEVEVKEGDSWGLSDYQRLPELWDLLNTLVAPPRTPLLCSSYGVELMLDLLQIWGGPKAMAQPGSVKVDRKLFDYLRVYAQGHYSVCVRVLASKKSFQRLVHKIAPIEAKFDLIFTANQPTAKTEENTFLHVSKVNLISGKEGFIPVDFEQLSKISRRKGQDTKTQVEQLVVWLEDKCQQFRYHASDTFDTFNLVRVLLPRQVAKAIADFGREDALRFLKLNEYSRICQQVADPERRPNVHQNLLALAGKVPWFKKIFA